MSVERFEFSLVPAWDKRYADIFPHPYPAYKAVPEWFKSMPLDNVTGGVLKRTVKNCVPFLDALTCGYIIPLATDIGLSVDESGVLHFESRTIALFDIHRSNQFPGAPFANFPVVKISNPWLIRTPPGYSTLFLPVLNRFGIPLVPLAGLVETDTFYREVNFPSVLTIGPGTKLTLPRGTPLVQVIPIKRDEFQSELVPADAEKYMDVDLHCLEIPENQNYYKDNAWRKKAYR
jgi:hypothetical protein